MTEPLAVEAVKAQLEDPHSAFSRARARMLEIYSEHAGVEVEYTATTLADDVTRSDVSAQIMVTTSFVTLMPGGHSFGSLMAMVKVDVQTEASTGDVQSHKAHVGNPILVGLEGWEPFTENSSTEELDCRKALGALPGGTG